MTGSAITSLEALRALYPEANPNSVAKERDHIDALYRQWLDLSRFFVIATLGADGLDCSPRGDKLGEGFVIEDEKTILIPDRRGNNRLDTLQNILLDPRVSLIFFVHGVNETVRVRGSAEIDADPDLLARFELKGKAPATVLRVHVDTVYFQCGRALVRSQHWGDLARPGAAPTAGQMLKTAIPEFDDVTYDESGDDRLKQTLY